MTIDSVPPGGEVREGDRVLGTTPLQLTIDNDGARLEPRRFTVTKDGYVAYSLVQGPSLDPVRIMAPLAAAPAAAPPAATASAPPAAAAPGRAHRPAPAPATAKPPAAPSSNNLDIRLTR
jgi:serine/threonine-protein kinase